MVGEGIKLNESNVALFDSEASEVKVSLSAADIEELINAGASLCLNNASGSMILSNDLLKSLPKGDLEASVDNSVKNVALGDKNFEGAFVVSPEIKVNGEAIHAFDAPVTLVANTGLANTNLGSIHLLDDGTFEGCGILTTDSEGYVSLDANEFSAYIFLSEEDYRILLDSPFVNDTEEKEGEEAEDRGLTDTSIASVVNSDIPGISENGNSIWVIICIAVAGVAAIVSCVFMIKKKK